MTLIPPSNRSVGLYRPTYSIPIHSQMHRQNVLFPTKSSNSNVPLHTPQITFGTGGSSPASSISSFSERLKSIFRKSIFATFKDALKTAPDKKDYFFKNIAPNMDSAYQHAKDEGNLEKYMKLENEVFKLAKKYRIDWKKPSEEEESLSFTQSEGPSISSVQNKSKNHEAVKDSRNKKGGTLLDLYTAGLLEAEGRRKHVEVPQPRAAVHPQSPFMLSVETSENAAKLPSENYSRPSSLALSEPGGFLNNSERGATSSLRPLITGGEGFEVKRASQALPSSQAVPSLYSENNSSQSSVKPSPQVLEKVKKGKISQTRNSVVL